MFRSRIARYSLLGLLLASTGCGFFRERLCCNRPGIMTGRFFGGGNSYPVEMASSDCSTCEGTLTSGGPMLGNPLVNAPIVTPGGSIPILPNPKIPEIKENPGRQGEYVPGMNNSRGIKGNETKSSREGF